MEIKTQFMALGKKKNNNIHEDNVGVDRIANYLSDFGFRAKLTFVYTDEDIKNSIDSIDFDYNFFGITLHSENVDFVVELSKMIKEVAPDAVIFVGSIFATFAAREIIDACDNIDFVVLGHGDIPLKLLYQDIRDNKKSLKQALNDSPYILCRNKESFVEPCYSNINIHSLPGRKYLANIDKTVVCIIGSHGCYGKCTFCSVPESGAKVSERSADDIFNEIERLHLKNKISFFYFLDSAIEGFGAQGKKRLKSLCELIIKSKYKISFRAFIRSESFQDTKEDIELLGLIRKAGFVNLIIGIESGNDNDLKVYNKLCSLNDNKRCLALFDFMNFEIILGYIILNPYTTYDDLQKNYDLLNESKFSLLHNYINCLQVNYNTPIFHRLKKDGLLMDFSFKSNGYEYNCVDERTQKVFEFIKDNFLESEISQKDFQFHNQITHIYYLLNVLDNTDEFSNEIASVRCTINSLCKDFFKILIKDYELIESKKCLNNFIGSLTEQYHKVEAINYKLLKRYLTLIN